MRMAKHKACLQIYEERLMFFKITARWKGCFHGITIAEIRMAKHKACLQIHEERLMLFEDYCEMKGVDVS